MPRNSIGKPVNSTRASKVNNKGFYLCPTSGRKHDTRRSEDDIYYASKLEYVTHLHLNQGNPDVQYQASLPIAGCSTSFTTKVKEWDFYIPSKNLIVECKGRWILNKGSKDKKAHFLLECQLAEIAGFTLVIVDNFNNSRRSNAWQLGPYTVQNYSTI